MIAPGPLEDTPRFVRLAHLFAEYDLPVPRILASNTERGYTLMTDVGGHDLEHAYANGRADEAVAKAIKHLHGLQAIPVCEVPPYTEHRFLQELDIFAQWFLSSWLGMQRPKGWREDCRSLVHVLLKQPTTVIHRDYHCQNLLVDNDELGIVDFQDALAGPALYDLASLLRDCYHRFSEADIARYLSQYLDGCELTFDDPAKRLDLTALQRQLKAVGIFARLHLRDGKDTHLRYIRPVLEHAHSISQRYDETTWLNPILEGCLDDAHTP